MKNKPVRFAKSNHLKQALGLPVSLVLAAVCGPSARAASFISFNPTFDFGTLTGSAQTTFQNSINAALGFYSTTLQTPSPITLNILFKADESVGLGQSSTFVNTVSYTDFRAGLVANAASSADTTALASLPTGANNPVNGSTTVFSSLPLLRALGYTVAGDNGGGLDSTISLKTSIMNLSRTGPQDMMKYDLQEVAYHEINEVLGFTSALNGLSNGAPAPTGAIGPADLFRYGAASTRSFTTALNANAYLSIDGGNASVVAFNQTQGGDFHDFNGAGPNVQDAFGTPGLQLNNAVAEKTALEVIGYNLIGFGSPAPIPEPGVPVLVGAALVGLAGVKKLRPRTA